MTINKKKWKMVYSILLTTGIIFLIISIIVFKNNLDLIKSGSKTTATVIDLQKSLASNSSDLTPIFKFTTTTGQEITFKGFGASSPPAFNIGEKVNIVYSPDKPDNAKVLTYFGMFGLSILLICLSIPMIVIGGGYFISQQFLT
jgi:hypothetical protein